MNHDATHCADYNRKLCPKKCYRAELTEELKHIHYFFPISYAHFKGTEECPFDNNAQGCEDLNKNAIALLKMLTKENEVRKGLNTMLDNELRRLGEENERLRSQKYMLHSDGRIEPIPTVESVRADTVRKMQNEVKARCRELFSGLDVCMIVDQIAKEMLEEV